MACTHYSDPLPSRATGRCGLTRQPVHCDGKAQECIKERRRREAERTAGKEREK